MWKQVAKSDQLEPGQPLAVEVEGQLILIVKTGQGLFAMEDSCPHQKQPLSTGKAKADKLTCRHHGIEIDMNSGKVTWAMGFLGLDDVKTFPIKQESEAIWIEV